MSSKTPGANKTSKNIPSKARSGRPRAGEREARREAVLDATLAELIDNGYEGVTMLSVAKRAGASKETLYRWFGNRDGLFTALIERNADASAARIAAALDAEADPRQTLVGYCIGLLTLLTSPGSIALNRAAMTSPALADILLQSGRMRVGPLVERYLTELNNTTDLNLDDPQAAFTLLYGLAVRDTQIRVLLGEDPPGQTVIADQASTAVQDFMVLVGMESSAS